MAAEEEDEGNILVDSMEEMERLGENLRSDGSELEMVRFILGAVWPALPKQSLEDLYHNCDEKEDNIEKVLWHFIAALFVTNNRNPKCLCRFVKQRSFRIIEKGLLYRILLVQIALELSSNIRSCRAFIRYVMTTSGVRDSSYYLPDERDVRNPIDIIPFLLRLFQKLEELNKIGPEGVSQLKRWLEKKQLQKAALLVCDNLTPLILRCSEMGGEYELHLEKVLERPFTSEMESFSSKSDFQESRPVSQVSMVKQCSEESNVSCIVLPNDSQKQEFTDSTDESEKHKKGITDNLQSQYRMMPLIAIDQWPPVKEHVYVDLALITSHNRPLISDINSFSRETVRGSVDDLLFQKEAVSFGEVFSAPRKGEIVLIDGRPGSGKSTLITKVTKDWAEGKILHHIEIFILVVLRQFKDVKLTLRDILKEYFDEITTSLVENMIRENDGEGTCIAFDGLDEYSTELFSSNDNFVLNVISGRDLCKALVYMTSRPATSNKVRSKFKLTKHIEIVGFTEGSKNCFIDKQCGGDMIRAQKLKNYLNNSPNIDRMCYLPLHLAMIIYLHNHDSGAGKFLPSSETELYYLFTIQTIYRDITKRAKNPNDLLYEYEVDDFDDLEDAEKNLFKKICQLAFDATVKQKQVYSAKEVKSVVKSTDLRETKSLGLLVVNSATGRRALPTATYNFIHLTHQEFLAAVHLVYYSTPSEQLQLLKKNADKEYMWVVWKFFCGLYADRMNDESQFLKAFDTIIRENLRTGLASLNMVHCAHESKLPALCSSLLSKLNGVLNVKDIKLHPSDCFSLSSVLVKAPEDARELDFSYCHFGPPGIHALVQPFHDKETLTFPGVQILRLRARVDDKPIGYEGHNNLILLIKKLPNLTELRLYGNRLTTYSFGHLSTTISGLKHLQVLILSRNHLDEATGVLLSIMLGQLTDLREFYISYNNLTDKGLRDMKPGLMKCKNLEILGLRGTGLCEQSGDELAEILIELPNLKLLELYQNKLGNVGLMGIIPGIKEAKSLETISLVNNNIDLQSADYGIASILADCIEYNTTLQTLRLFYNSFAQNVQVEIRTAAVSRVPELGLAL